MADNRNSQVPEGNYDPAGSTQMFKAFVEEAAPARQAGPGARQQRRAEQQRSGSSNPAAKVGLVLALVLVIGAAVWLVMR
ncbi:MULTISPECIES: hypothetical protein [Streptomyces]|uniref:Uncharacterized protein n=1 Tax=Streptomyces spororaveus TaxID=284039 RepID=A0ABQ3TFK1_9ACTN|nr:MULTISPECIES: hypothetical protein [Streptomyces]MCM9080485.1 hypothetical protein [Streptomyces spororaveus]MCX5305099.1 hypothetical protein [Streptomyces sp. NBC_00160]GHI79188.1 hypothetical protein Sspor_47490 [Streptomyces spororaveus]